MYFERRWLLTSERVDMGRAVALEELLEAEGGIWPRSTDAPGLVVPVDEVLDVSLRRRRDTGVSGLVGEVESLYSVAESRVEVDVGDMGRWVSSCSW